jgi:hypothetical protein
LRSIEMSNFAIRRLVIPSAVRIFRVRSFHGELKKATAAATDQRTAAAPLVLGDSVHA